MRFPEFIYSLRSREVLQLGTIIGYYNWVLQLLWSALSQTQQESHPPRELPDDTISFAITYFTRSIFNKLPLPSARYTAIIYVLTATP